MRRFTVSSVPYDRDLTLEDMNIAKADSYYS